jgi:glycosyltransferase involved in cell wall biosynthesis
MIPFRRKERSMMTLPRVLADTWYGESLGDRCDPLPTALDGHYPRWLASLAGRIGLLRGWLFFRLGRSYDLLATVLGAPGSLTLLLLEAYWGRQGRRIILLEFIRNRPTGASRFWSTLVVGPGLRRTLCAAHVLTDWERGYYARRYGVPAERFHHVPWPMLGDTAPVSRRSRRAQVMVLSSGREACDWETLLSAAEGATWPLTIICGRQDLPRIERRNKLGRARVLCDVPLPEHQRQLDGATVYVLALQETHRSVGHVRLMHAIEMGVPVIATAVAGLVGYAIDGETALVVRAGDPLVLRDAIDYLLAHPDERERLVLRARAWASGRTRARYLSDLGALIRDVAADGCPAVERDDSPGDRRPNPRVSVPRTVAGATAPDLAGAAAHPCDTRGSAERKGAE